MKGRTAKKYEDPHAWQNEFYQYITSKIDEETFRPFFKEGNMGAPNAPIRIRHCARRSKRLNRREGDHRHNGCKRK